jgi:hypothetical protein
VEINSPRLGIFLPIFFMDTSFVWSNIWNYNRKYFAWFGILFAVINNSEVPVNLRLLVGTSKGEERLVGRLSKNRFWEADGKCPYASWALRNPALSQIPLAGRELPKPGTRPKGGESKRCADKSWGITA